MSDFDTEEERQVALNALALVRLALQDEPLETNNEIVNVIIEDLDEDDVATLLFRVADLAAVILASWHQAALMAMPPEYHDEIASPEELLDGLVKMVVTGEEPERPDDL